jgi:hypothetical protein
MLMSDAAPRFRLKMNMFKFDCVGWCCILAKIIFDMQMLTFTTVTTHINEPSIHISLQEVIVHECAPKFSRSLFERYMGHIYDVNVVVDPVRG